MKKCKALLLCENMDKGLIYILVKADCIVIKSQTANHNCSRQHFYYFFFLENKAWHLMLSDC